MWKSQNKIRCARQTLRGICTTIDTGQVKTKLNTVESAPDSKCGGSIIYAKTDKRANSNRSQGISVVESEEDGDEKNATDYQQLE